MRFEKIWVQQCRATKTIKRRFGAKSAFDYLIREKLITFAHEAERSPGVRQGAAAIPRGNLAGVQSIRACGIYREPETSSAKAITSAAVYVSLGNELLDSPSR
jgi:hypothetical protein